MLKKTYDWLESKIDSPYASFLLGFLFYLEAFLLFIPVDPMLIVYCIERRKKAFYYATIATLSSVLGGITGYLIGYTLWESMGLPLIRFFISAERFHWLRTMYQNHATLSVLVAGFTPIPYKIAALSAGYCKLPIVPFIFYSLLARGARFYLYAVTISIWGHQMKQYIDRYFNLLLLLSMIIIVIVMLLLKK